MSTYNMVGTGVYVWDKVQQIQEAVKLYQEATNPNTKEQAAYDIATKTCEAIGIGIASYFVEKLTTKTGLDRVFDSLRKNKSFEKYLQDQVTTQTLQGYGVSTVLGWILNSTRNFIIENRYLDPVFQEFDDIGTWLGGELYDLLNPKLDIDMENISEKYSSDLDKSATYRIVYIDPLTLDLDSDGIETVGESGRSGVMFDTDADGINTASGWISADDGLLVRDINKNGIIDNGSEFFGDSTQLLNGSKAADGFSALTDLDDNHDGKVDANDSAFTELKIWRDLNQDGVSSSNELFSLSDVNVAGLNVENKNEFISLTGSNYINKTGTYTKSDGTTAVMADVNFVTNNLITEYKDKIAVSEEIAGLPNLTGYGRLRSLQEAATISPALAEILKQYAVATTKDQQMSLIDDLVLEWAKTDPQWNAYGTKEYHQRQEYDPNSPNVIYLRRGESYIPTVEDPTPVHRDIYHIADAFFNRQTLSVYLPSNSTPDNDPLRIAERTYTQIQNSIYDSLLTQTRLKPYLDTIELVFDEIGIHINYDKMNAMLLANSTGDNLKNRLDDLKDLERVVGGSLTDWDMKETYITIGELNHFNENFISYSRKLSFNFINVVAGTGLNNQISGSVNADLISGDAGNDNISGSNGDDYLIGGADNDTLNGGNGEDSLTGGTGNDSLNGGAGNDIYTIVTGDGADTICDYDVTTGNTDIVQFSDVKSTEITALERIGSSLVLKYGTADQLTISNYFSGTAYGIEQFQFSDGVVWDSAAIKATVITLGDSNNNSITGYSDGTNRIYGLDGNDYLNGSALNDTLEGGNGNDSLTGNNGNDYLLGGADNDTLNGGDGDDLLTGGIGNDSLNGGIGNDTYTIETGDGIDIISDYDVTTGNTDIVQFSDVKSTEITALERVGSSLVLKYGTADQLTISNYFSGTAYGIEQFQFSDGVVWDSAAIKATVITLGDSNNNTITGYSDGTNRIYGLDGNDYLNGGALDDTLEGGNGNDSLTGNNGNDYLLGGADNDTLNGNDGDDSLIGGLGNDSLNGGIGNDTYTIETGNGIDIISDYDVTSGNTDIVQFSDVKSTEITALERTGSSLVLKYGTADQLTISNYFSGTAYGIEQFQFSDGVVWDSAAIKATVITLGDSNNNIITGYSDGTNRIYGLDGNDYLNGGALDDTLEGGNGRDNLTGNNGNDYLLGGADNDTLNGGDGDDLLTGGIGNDSLNGGIGNDTYTIETGDGIDIISDYDVTTGNTDIVQFSDVKSTEITALERVGSSLVLKYGTADQLTISNYFSGAAYGIEQFQFSDGVVWDSAAIKATVITLGDSNNNSITGYSDGTNRIYGLDGNDYLSGGVLNDTIDGGNGNDNLTGNSGNDYLIGGADNDTLNGGDGDDVLIGGIGNDSLVGGKGNDQYTFMTGDGADMISDYDTTVGYTDVLKLQDNTSDQLWFTKTGNNLDISVIGRTDKMTVQNWYSSNAYHVEQFKTSDGKTLLDSQVANLVSAMASMTPPAAGQTTLPQNYQDQLSAVLAANWK